MFNKLRVNTISSVLEALRFSRFSLNQVLDLSNIVELIYSIRVSKDLYELRYGNYSSIISKKVQHDMKSGKALMYI